MSLRLIASGPESCLLLLLHLLLAPPAALAAAAPANDDDDAATSDSACAVGLLNRAAWNALCHDEQQLRCGGRAFLK